VKDVTRGFLLGLVLTLVLLAACEHEHTPASVVMRDGHEFHCVDVRDDVARGEWVVVCEHPDGTASELRADDVWEVRG
jgi:hypothetical protein